MQRSQTLHKTNELDVTQIEAVNELQKFTVLGKLKINCLQQADFCKHNRLHLYEDSKQNKSDAQDWSFHFNLKSESKGSEF